MDIKSVDLFIKLQNGVDVHCLNCGDGYYKPLTANGEYQNCYHFKCDKCGDMVIATKKLRMKSLGVD